MSLPNLTATIPADMATPVQQNSDAPKSDPSSFVSPTRRFIRQPALFRRIDVSSATGARMKAAGKIGPQPICLNARCIRYDLEEVLAWISSRRPDGTLPDAKTWAAMWPSIQKANGRRS